MHFLRQLNISQYFHFKLIKHKNIRKNTQLQALFIQRTYIRSFMYDPCILKSTVIS